MTSLAHIQFGSLPSMECRIAAGRPSSKSLGADALYGLQGTGLSNLGTGFNQFLWEKRGRCLGTEVFSSP